MSGKTPVWQDKATLNNSLPDFGTALDKTYAQQMKDIVLYRAVIISDNKTELYTGRKTNTYIGQGHAATLTNQTWDLKDK